MAAWACLAERGRSRAGSAKVGPKRCDARAAAAVVEMLGYPSISIASIYLTVGQGLSRDNLAILAAVGVAIEVQGCPSLIGGDFNCSPSALHGSTFAESAGHCIVAPAEPTYFSGQVSSILDFSFRVLALCLHS